MSLRAALLLLAFANLAFFGWAHLVDVAPEPPPNDTIAHLPQLKLLSEVQHVAGAARSSTSASVKTSPQAGVAGSTSASGSVTSSGSSGAKQDATGTAAPVARGSAPPASVQRCVTVGPFNDPARAEQAADLLQQRGFRLHERSEQAAEQGYWVYVGGLSSDSDETAVLRRLVQNGVSDAHAMPESDKGRRISAGFFTEHDGAERRLRAVLRLGLHAEIERRTESASTRWVDVDIDSSNQSLPTEGLLSVQEIGARLEVKECPSGSTGGGEGGLPVKSVAEAQPPASAKTAASASR